MPKSLEEKAAEVAEYVQAKGWNDRPVPFEQAMALLHEEAAEAGHAWRDHGLDDMTLSLGEPVVGESDPGEAPGLRVRGRRLPKPEGVGSELADVMIRWLDYETRYKMLGIEYLEDDPHCFEVDGNFMVNINTLHGLIAAVTHARDTSYEGPAQAFAAVLKFTQELAAYCGIDLEAEYERKMRYNRSRPYRHGNRRA
jgi:NTP pyrophosphatase (non-canonical NTP hydrolase)